jgi:hypothetical protein
LCTAAGIPALVVHRPNQLIAADLAGRVVIGYAE